MATTHYLISKQTVGSGGASSITFSNIPQTYTDLCLVVSPRTDRASIATDYLKITFNSNTSSYSGIQLRGDGSTTGSGTFSGIGATQYAGEINASTSTTNTFSNVQIYIPNYTSSNYKSYSVESAMENNATANYLTLDAGLWSNTAAITSIAIAPGVGTNFVQYTTASLYGVSATGDGTKVPYASGGDVIATDGTY